MLKKEKKKTIAMTFSITLILIIILFVISVLKTNSFNRMVHNEDFTGKAFSEDPKESGVDIRAVPRSSTWTKLFDLNNEGKTEHDYQAYTYDFTVSNETKDEVSSFTFKLTFDREVFLLSAWNGALELHQDVTGNEYVATVPDLREFHPEDYDLDTVTVDGEVLVRMKAGDYLVYLPSSSEGAMEIPIEPHEGTVPGIILYVAIDEDISGSGLEIEYTFHRLLQSEPLFWVSMAGLALWLIALIIVVITSAQIKKYETKHERDNKIIQESIETFTGFIDAKDPYTNGHSTRVAEYTRLIAKEMGYEGEELDRIYYVALLHDCGKIGVPDNILRKPGKLTDEEFEIIKSHTVRGGDILSSFKTLNNVGEGALYHHERYDGRGYPEGKTGKDIPLVARMICVADSFDAMNSNRVYRNKLTKDDILNEIKNNKGTQFDPEIADVFLGLIKNKKIVME
ncbi:MAG: HD-GYP domain-containing protein [Lachnospiraceae bacterium]|nr:HD-GYP domain-containing protein [Lachnospiraceae bacterium]